MKRICLIAAFVLAVPAGTRAELKETPFFAQAVANGSLPKIDERVPTEPELAEFETAGSPGGELRMLMGGPKDTRMMVVYGYARLVGYTPALKLASDILGSLDVQDGRIFTLHIFRRLPASAWPVDRRPEEAAAPA